MDSFNRERLQRIQGVLDNCTADIVDIQNRTTPDHARATMYAKPAFELSEPIENAGNESQEPRASLHVSLAIEREFTHKIQMQQNMVSEAHETIGHLQATIGQLEEETRVLRLDAVRDDESYRAALLERDLLKEQLARSEIDSSKEQLKFESTLNALQKELRLNQSELDYARQILIQSQSALRATQDHYDELQEKLNSTLLKLGRFQKKYYDVKEIEGHQIQALDSLGNKLLQMQETLPQLQHTVRDYYDKNQRLREMNESSKWRAQVLEAKHASLFGHLEAAKAQINRQEENAICAQKESDRQQEMVESLAEDLSARTNLEIALKAEIESLRSVAVEKNFLMEYMQNELDSVNERDAKEMKILQEALDTTVRWREEVVFQNRLNDEMADTIAALNASLEENGALIQDLGYQIFCIRDRVDDLGNNPMMDIMIRDLDRLIDMFWENDAALKKVKKSIHSGEQRIVPDHGTESPFREQSMDFEKELQRIERMQENSTIQRMIENKYARKSTYNPLKWFR